MNENAKKAIDILKTGDYTCVLVKGEQVYTSKQRGVRPLMDWFHDQVDLVGYAAADKVVGKGAAFLYVALEVDSVYASVISEMAIQVLEEHHILYEYDQKVEAIQNRDHTGFCPMETAVKEISDVELAIHAMEQKMKKLEKNR